MPISLSKNFIIDDKDVKNRELYVNLEKIICELTKKYKGLDDKIVLYDLLKICSSNK